MSWNIPKVKPHPPGAGQCNDCGGWGCTTCGDKGWLPDDHPSTRKCARDGCGAVIPPSQVAVYCSNGCAADDAD